jgi:putative hydrolase of the HAD superfamily
MPEPIPRPLQAVFFDAGETLLRPWPSFWQRFVAVAEAHGETFEAASVEAASAAAAREAAWPSDWTDPATQRAFWGGFYDTILTRLGHRGDRAELVDALFAAFTDPAGYKLFDDARPALATLAGRGLLLGVVSNFEPWLRRILELEGVADCFGAVAISGVLGVAKPDPRIFHAALQQAGVAAEATVHVGDHADDVAGARAAGITPVLLDRYDRRPHADSHRVRSLTELVELLAGADERP